MYKTATAAPEAPATDGATQDLAGLSGAGWRQLALASAAFPTQDLPWSEAGLETFGGEPAIVATGAAEAPDAIAALVDRDGWRQPIGGGPTGEPTDLLASSPDALAALAEQVARDRRPLLLPRIPATSPTIAALRSAFGPRALVRVSEGSGHPAIELNEDWAEPGGGLSSSRRQALRRSRRRAEKLGEIAVSLLAPAPDEVDALLDRAFAIEARSWKGAEGTALVHSPDLARFVRRYAAATAALGTLRVQLLEIGDDPVAMQIGVEWRNRLWLLKIGYDEAFAAVSPGQILLAESVADAARRGHDRYELLGTAAPWTDVWTKDVAPTVCVAVYPASRRGAVRLGAAAAQHAGAVGRERARRAFHAAQRTAETRYVAGPDLADALREEARCAAAGYPTVVGHWGADSSPAAEVTAGCFAAADALPAGSQLAIKLPALRTDAATLDDLVERCRTRDVGLHFDALAPATAEKALTEAVRLSAAAPGVVGCTLPGRWERSVADAELAVANPLRVRVVKGEWEDPDAPGRDPRAGFLAVVDTLAGRVTRVELATQDAELATTALERLLAAGTACELQVLYAMSSRAAVRAARRLDVPVRVYIPYGRGRVPYEVDRDPRSLARLAFDLLPGAGFAPPGTRFARAR
jgi:CelD/BcsL family acetyltransferase involved in cellulose biosynthesis